MGFNFVNMPHVVVEVHIDKTKGFGHAQRTGKGVAVYQILRFFRVYAIDIGLYFFSNLSNVSWMSASMGFIFPF